jgi:hypothetical protein
MYFALGKELRDWHPAPGLERIDSSGYGNAHSLDSLEAQS